MQLRIALLEDDVSQAELVSAWLKDKGYFCHHFETGISLLRRVANDSFDLYLVDWELPDTNGIDIVKQLRAEYNIQSPILFTTSRDSENDIVMGLEAGADDYLIKPLRQNELYARINATLRRVETNTANESRLSFPPYVFDKKNETIYLHDTAIKLTSREFQVALFLFENIGCVLSRGHILERIWGLRSDLNTRTVDTHISIVRTKLQLRPANGWKLTSIYRHGYRLENVSDDSENDAKNSA